MLVSVDSTAYGRPLPDQSVVSSVSLILDTMENVYI